MPLCEKTRCVIESIQNISTKEDESLYDILNGKMGANYASKTKTFKEMLGELNKYFNEETYKFPDSYKLPTMKSLDK